jgi:hypothetical protein
MDKVLIMNLLFCIAILIFGVLKFKKTAVKAYLYIGLAYGWFGVCNIQQLLGWGSGDMKMVLAVERIFGYALIYVGLLI